MASTVTLDITGYTDLKQQPPTITGRRIKLLVFLNGREANNTFKEYTGVLAAVTRDEVRFDEHFPYFYREVNLGDTVIPLKLYTVYEVTIEDNRTYMWQNIDGSDVGSAIVTFSPKKVVNRSENENEKEKRVAYHVKKGSPKIRRTIRFTEPQFSNQLGNLSDGSFTSSTLCKTTFS